MTELIRIVVADDHPLFRDGVVHSLASEPDLAVVGQAAIGEEALRLARDLLPDVVLLDIGMPGWDGLITAEKITTACPATKIVMLTVVEDEDKLLAAFKAGARGYVLKGVSARELASVVRAAAHGEVYVSPSLAASILLALTRGRPPDPLEHLTEREREILKLVGQGLTNREIGQRIHLSEKTVKHYITNILQKLLRTARQVRGVVLEPQSRGAQGEGRHSGGDYLQRRHRSSEREREPREGRLGAADPQGV